MFQKITQFQTSEILYCRLEGGGVTSSIILGPFLLEEIADTTDKSCFPLILIHDQVQ